jgi:hypothetical protein
LCLRIVQVKLRAAYGLGSENATRHFGE